MVFDTTFTPENNEKSRREADGLSLLEQLAEPSVAQVTPDEVVQSVLEKLKEDAEKKCKNPHAPILFGMAKDRSMALVHKTRCKCWKCRSCGAKNARRAIAICLNHVNKHPGQWYFMTITAHENWHVTPEASYKNLSRNFHKLRKRLREIHGGRFSYFRVWECHADGTFHMHFITNVEIPYKEKIKDGKTVYTCALLKRHARQSGLGFMVDYQPLDNAGFAAHYVAKYLAKSITDDALWLPGMRRIQTSQDWEKLPDLREKSDFAWKYIEGALHAYRLYSKAVRDGVTTYLSHTGQPLKFSGILRYYEKVRQVVIENKKRFLEPNAYQEWLKQSEQERKEKEYAYVKKVKERALVHGWEF